MMQFRFKFASLLMAMVMLFLVACNKETAPQPTEIAHSQMVLSKVTQNAVSTEPIISIPPPPPGFPIRVRSININCNGSSLTARTSVVLETVFPYMSYSPTSCYRFWYRKVGTQAWQYISICNQPQNLFNLNLARGQYELIVGPGAVTSPTDVRCSTVQTFTVVKCLTELAEF
ncbi:MAG: hypothetical protein RIS64_4205 [Bacteroidota bacterium]|jgi:hypothetical protein